MRVQESRARSRITKSTLIRVIPAQVQLGRSGCRPACFANGTYEGVHMRSFTVRLGAALTVAACVLPATLAQPPQPAVVQPAPSRGTVVVEPTPGTVVAQPALPPGAVVVE